MSPVLLLPAGLAALAALALPLLVHLARREETRPLDFAALRWLEQRPRPRRRIRLDERLLLAVRLLLLALLALWLARPALTGGAGGATRVLVVPGADPAGAPAGARWLAPGFPQLDAPAPSGPLPTASLLRQADAELPPGDRLVVLAPPLIDGTDAERPRLAHPTTWRVVAGRVATRASAAGPPPRLAIRAAPGQPTTILAAVARAWRPGEPIDLAASGAPLPPTGRLLAWLSPEPPPAAVRDWIARGGTALLAGAGTSGAEEAAAIIWRDRSGVPLLEARPLGHGRLLRLLRPLTLAAMPQAADADFPRHLRDLVAPPPPPTRAYARDYAPLAGRWRYPQPARSLQSWLGALIAALFLAERWLATRRARSPGG